MIWQSRLFIQNLCILVRREADFPDPCFGSTERRHYVLGAPNRSIGFSPVHGVETTNHTKYSKRAGYTLAKASNNSAAVVGAS